MPNAYIGEDAILVKTIVGQGAIIEKGVKCGLRDGRDNPYKSKLCTGGIVLIKNDITIKEGTEIYKNSMVGTH